MATNPSDPLPLAGQRVLVCRPEPEASRLAEHFRQAGAQVRILPLICRQPLPETAASRNIIQNLDQFAHIIAVSPYAARLLLEQLDRWWPQPPVGIRWYGVGSGTAAVLAEAGLSPQKPAAGWTSEALLALPSLANPGSEKVLLVRGEEGRELLRETLTERGAAVTVLPLYRRFCPPHDPEWLKDTFSVFKPTVVVTLSGETLNNFIALSDNSVHNSRDALLIVPASRVADQARQAGFLQPLIPGSLADNDLVTSVIQKLANSGGGPGNTK